MATEVTSVPSNAAEMPTIPSRPTVAISTILPLMIEEHEDTRAMYAFALSAGGFDVVVVKDTT